MNFENNQDDIPQNHGTYAATLFDPRWKARRVEILLRDKSASGVSQCVICKSEEQLQIHHRQYHFSKGRNQFKNPWEYPDYLLITLCERCHQKGHRQYNVPVKQVK